MSITQVQSLELPRSGEHEDLPLEPLSTSGPTVRQRTATRLQKTIITVQLSGVNFTNSVAGGLVFVGLPIISKDIRLPESLAFWPASVCSLATASTLILAGSIADNIGPRIVELIGCFLAGSLMLGVGASRTAYAMIIMRALQGVGFAMHLSSSVAIISRSFPSGRGRNISFSCLGLSQPLGFSFGLVLGGLLQDSLGWRAGWYLSGGLTLLLAAAGLWAIPTWRATDNSQATIRRLEKKIDWVGVFLSSTFMTLLCYLLAVLSTDIKKIHDWESILLLTLSLCTLPLFVYWMHRQVRNGRAALIPNSLWKNSAFAGTCATIVISFAVLNSLELFSSLFFQRVQHLSALQASIRLLPSFVVGTILNFSMGLFVHKVPPVWIIIISSLLCAGSPLLMATIQPSSVYWANAFVAQLLQPISTDAIFTVGLILITEIFPEDTHALAGAVFNTVGQFGNALGLSIMQVISTVVSKQHQNKPGEEAYMAGFRASFWAMFAFMLLCATIGAASLSRTGKIGMKRD